MVLLLLLYSHSHSDLSSGTRDAIIGIEVIRVMMVITEIDSSRRSMSLLWQIELRCGGFILILTFIPIPISVLISLLAPIHLPIRIPILIQNQIQVDFAISILIGPPRFQFEPNYVELAIVKYGVLF